MRRVHTEINNLFLSRFQVGGYPNVPIPQIYVPELEDVADIHHISLRKIIRLKGKSSGAVIALRKLINSSNWANRLSLAL